MKKRDIYREKFIFTFDTRKHQDVIKFLRELEPAMRRHVVVWAIRTLMRNQDELIRAIFGLSASDQSETTKKPEVDTSQPDKGTSSSKDKDREIDFGEIFK